MRVIVKIVVGQEELDCIFKKFCWDKIIKINISQKVERDRP